MVQFFFKTTFQNSIRILTIPLTSTYYDKNMESRVCWENSLTWKKSFGRNGYRNKLVVRQIANIIMVFRFN